MESSIPGMGTGTEPELGALQWAPPSLGVKPPLETWDLGTVNSGELLGDASEGFGALSLCFSMLLDLEQPIQSRVHTRRGWGSAGSKVWNSLWEAELDSLQDKG